MDYSCVVGSPAVAIKKPHTLDIKLGTGGRRGKESLNDPEGEECDILRLTGSGHTANRLKRRVIQTTSPGSVGTTNLTRDQMKSRGNFRRIVCEGDLQRSEQGIDLLASKRMTWKGEWIWIIPRRWQEARRSRRGSIVGRVCHAEVVRRQDQSDQTHLLVRRTIREPMEWKGSVRSLIESSGLLRVQPRATCARHIRGDTQSLRYFQRLFLHTPLQYSKCAHIFEVYPTAISLHRSAIGYRISSGQPSTSMISVTALQQRAFHLTI
ncbi:hypothetical protein BJ322DRAFT_115188 [Thelephora terrestris]|uniref:Uncharacterized protein n=1 Tax=Thelephora terrestris TaxID=56493 RepID=A0A9P6LD98_9AGAM|nr:hypothetical protein BJ322DRAFT_115188 [Thelephora terrestris]